MRIFPCMRIAIDFIFWSGNFYTTITDVRNAFLLEVNVTPIPILCEFWRVFLSSRMNIFPIGMSHIGMEEGEKVDWA